MESVCPYKPSVLFFAGKSTLFCLFLETLDYLLSDFQELKGVFDTHTDPGENL